MVITLADARALKYCSRGMREMCERHGVSWEKVIKEGIESEELLLWNEAMATKIVEQAEQRNAR